MGVHNYVHACVCVCFGAGMEAHYNIKLLLYYLVFVCTFENSYGEFYLGYQGNGQTCTYVGVCNTNNGGCHHLASCSEVPGKNTSICAKLILIIITYVCF